MVIVMIEIVKILKNVAINNIVLIKNAMYEFFQNFIYSILKLNFYIIPIFLTNFFPFFIILFLFNKSVSLYIINKPVANNHPTTNPFVNFIFNNLPFNAQNLINLSYFIIIFKLFFCLFH